MILLTATKSNSNLTSLSEKIASGLGRSLSQGAGDCTIKGESLFLCLSKNLNRGIIPIKSFMVGVEGSIRACWILDPVDQPNTPTALSLVASGGSLKTTVKELVMSQHNCTTKPSITELALIEASTTIGSIAESNAQFTSGFASYLDSFDKQLSEITVFELIDLLNKYRAVFNNKKTPILKTSRFNVLNRKKQLIAKNLAFDQAKKYQNCIVKFSCMSEVSA